MRVRASLDDDSPHWLSPCAQDCRPKIYCCASSSPERPSVWFPRTWKAADNSASGDSIPGSANTKLLNNRNASLILALMPIVTLVCGEPSRHDRCR